MAGAIAEIASHSLAHFRTIDARPAGAADRGRAELLPTFPEDLRQAARRLERLGVEVWTGRA